MHVISFCNQKGGVGKTTSTLNTGAALAARGVKVLLIDLDAQGNLTASAGVQISDEAPTVYEVLKGSADINAAIVKRGPYDILPADIRLSGAELEAPFTGSHSRNKNPLRIYFDRLPAIFKPYNAFRAYGLQICNSPYSIAFPGPYGLRYATRYGKACKKTDEPRNRAYGSAAYYVRQQKKPRRRRNGKRGCSVYGEGARNYKQCRIACRSAGLW